MARDRSTVEWRGEEFSTLIENVTLDTLDEVAEAAAVYARDIMEDEGIVDTHFAANSFYHVGPRESTYEDNLPAGRYLSTRTGRYVRRERLPREEPHEGEAIVANAATYYYWLEVQHAILYRALRTITEEEVGAKMRQIYRGRGGR